MEKKEIFAVIYGSYLVFLENNSETKEAHKQYLFSFL